MGVRAFWSVVFLLATACSGAGTGDSESGPTIDETKPPLQPDGPLYGLALVAGTSEDGSFTDPQLTFTTDDTEATAVIGLGSDVPEDSTLTVDWYRLVGVDGREHLFTHEIPIGPGGLASSQGVAEGGLAPGLYETVATLGERQVRTPWVVRVADEVAGAPAAVAGAFALLSTVSQAQPHTMLEPPQPGDLDYDGPPLEGEPSGPGPCKVEEISPGTVPMTGINATVFWLGTCSSMTLTATVSGPPLTLASSEIAQGDLSFLRGDGDVCELPGGSDLPGTTVQFAATGSEGARRAESYTLKGHDVIAAAVESVPPAGSSVEPGQALSFHAFGLTFPPALGVEKLSLYAAGELVQSVGNKSGSSEPQPCDSRRHLAEIVSERRYRVPEDPPAVIEVCAEALGFDGSENRNCIELYTGEVWEGTIEAETERDYQPPPGAPDPPPCLDAWRGELRFVVDENGIIDGEGRADLMDYVCDFPNTKPARAIIFSVGGESRDDELVLILSGERSIPSDGQQWAGLPNLLLTDPGQAGARPPGPPLRVPKVDDCTARGDVTVTGSYGPLNDPTVAEATFQLRCVTSTAG